MRKIVLAAVSVAMLGGRAAAFHPMITEDSGVLGKGARQAEAAFEYVDERGCYTRDLGVVLSYGLTEKLDLLLGLPWTGWTAQGQSESGLSDVSLESKIQLGRKYGWTFLVKPCFSLPTGDDKKGLGSGKSSAWVYGVAGREAGPREYYLNAGYRYNDSDGDAEKNLFKLSGMAAMEVLPGTRLAADVALESSEAKEADEHPLTGMLGAIYSPSENLDLDAGVKFGLNGEADDLGLLAGVTYRF